LLDHRCSAEDDPTTYTGYQVELFRLVATDLGWKEGRDWYFSCEDWTPMLEDLLSANGTCTMSAAGVCRVLSGAECVMHGLV
jgi:ABC-type amino acid transport substrate-binding protein